MTNQTEVVRAIDENITAFSQMRAVATDSTKDGVQQLVEITILTIALNMAQAEFNKAMIKECEGQKLLHEALTKKENN